MSRCRLNRLTLQNFMGHRDFTLDLQGESAVIRGTNATGKTSLFSAFTWLLFGKDASGQAQFDIKTLGPDGEPLHNLEHSVEGEFQIGDDTLTLRKVLVEVWTRKRGSSSEEFTGHRVDHYLDGVPCLKKEYDARVAELAPEGVFRLLTDPDAFMSLHWEKRRALLLEVCGDVTDAEVIASSSDLEALPGILGKRSLDEHRKVVDSKRREINRELQAIPTRVDEATQGKPEAPDASREDLEAKVTTLRDARSALERDRARLEAGGEIAELQAKAREIDGKIQDVARKVTASAEEALASARKDRDTKDDASNTALRDVTRLRGEITDARAVIERLDRFLEDLRVRWRNVDERPTPHSDVPEACPACGQSLPTEQITAAHQKALEEHNVRKAAELEQIEIEGQTGKVKREELAAALAGLERDLSAAERRAEAARDEAHAASRRVEELQQAIPDPTQDPKHQQLTSEKAALEAKIAALREGNTETLAGLRDDLAKLDAEINDTLATVAAFDQIAKADARINDLTKQEKKLAREFEDLEHQLHLLDAFTRAKAELLTERINSRFQITSFRLFSTLINGGLEDACTATVNGIPYGTGLNRAARINAGLDVIKVLQEHHGFWPPVIVDEAESVVDLLPLDCQTIKLAVDERYPELHIELEKEAVPA